MNSSAGARLVTMRIITTVSLASLLVFGLQEARGQGAGADWPMYAGDYASTGASPLSEIRTALVEVDPPSTPTKPPTVEPFWKVAGVNFFFL